MKNRSRSLKPNQLFIMSQCYIHAHLVEICQPVHKIWCTQALFWLIFGSLSPTVTLKIRSRSPKPNQLFIMSECYINTNLVRIHPSVYEISCKQESVTLTPTLTPTPKTICPPPLRWGTELEIKITCNSFQSIQNSLSRLMTKPTKWDMRPAKTQISLGICPVWSHLAHCEDWSDWVNAQSDQSSPGAQSFCWFCNEAAHIVDTNATLAKARQNLQNHKCTLYILQSNQSLSLAIYE